MSRQRRIDGIRAMAVGAVWLIVSPLAMGQTGSVKPNEVISDLAVRSNVDELILKLADPDYLVRQSASNQLEQAGLDAFEKIRIATLHANPEVATTARYLLNSMRVAWTMETDSLEVKRLLKNYNDQRQDARLAIIQRLSEIATDDARATLVRLARYEASEMLSKNAALMLLGTVNDRAKSLDPAQIAAVVRQGMGDSSRPAAQWLRTFAGRTDPNSLYATWNRFLTDERRLLESNSDATNRETTKKLYRFAAHWLSQSGRHEDAVRWLTPYLELVTSDVESVKTDVAWMLEAGLPEGPQMLSEARPEQISHDPYLSYLLAESYLLSNNPGKAQEVADLALKLTGSDNRAGARFGQGPDISAYQRFTLFRFLSDRGQYDWAERELTQALSSTLNAQTEILLRNALADFYNAAESYEKGIEVYRVLIERSKTDVPFAEALQRRDDESKTELEKAQGNLHYFQGMLYKQRGQFSESRRELIIAIGYLDNNPDFLIALSKVLESDAQAKLKFDEALKSMVDSYKQAIVQLESEIATTAERNYRASKKKDIAMECNQLAWLLAGVGASPQEAIRLSERSLSIVPDYPVYLDTLARCNFAAGNYQKAVEIQSRAVKLEPFERQMQRQLAEFKEALDENPPK